ncbi:conserved hypothetical protein [Shewanella denitrificans OS217]|uniref:DUF3014 domain-containing protein n=1 Tax=Shewanella denitrificans (strain OS217 / ATCC BAA-1090 / DSM 15013) TaxID=318161 RepID=Q12IH4_SHEDO|nr:DUF3014 domain-containing protein [Shewanella denitrificans]ABE56752.1 conserved hypothetical protein [Shewanella denitrificans OS217]
MQVNQEDRISPTTEKPSSGNNTPLIAIAVIALLAVGGYFYISSDSDEMPEQLITPVELPDSIPTTPIEQDPIEEQELAATGIPSSQIEGNNSQELSGTTDQQTANPADAKPVEPLPALAESDDFIESKTLAIANGMKIEPLILKKDMARQFVVFVDNLAQGELVRKASPIKGPDRNFSVSEITNKIFINPDSFHRYDLYANFVAGLNEQELLSTYKELTPLFNEAFEELGYSDVSFDARMQQAMKMVLDAPIIEDPIELKSVTVNYHFAEHNLEALPNAQKFLIRMGPENTRKIKAAVKKLQLLLDNQ